MARGERQLRRRARRDVRMETRPIMQGLRREERQAEKLTNRQMQRVGNIYEGLQGHLQPMGGAFDAQAQRITADLRNQLGGLQGLIGGGPEAGAAGGAFGALGAGGLEQLGSQRMRNLAFQTSAQRQAGLEPAVMNRQLLQQLADMQKEYGTQRLEVKRGMGDLTRQRMDELRDQALEQRMAREEMRSNRAMTQWILDQIGQVLGPGPGGGGRNRRRRRGGGGGGGGGGDNRGRGPGQRR